jgi:hypothetical protein
MLDVNQAYVIAKSATQEPYLISILNFGEDFGFLFTKSRTKTVFGASYILVNKKTKVVTILPAIPSNIGRIDVAQSIPLTAIRIL